MKSKELLLRQNDKDAIELIRASERCYNTERILKYLMIFLSFGICLAAIFNRYLPQMSHASNIYEIQQTAATYMNLISGAIIVAGIPIGFYSSRMHTEGTVLRDRYEAYIFDNAPNLSILRPISHTFVSVYSKKLHKTDEKFQNFLFNEEENVNEAEAQFEYINRVVHEDYKLYLSIQPFFITIWLGFVILIILIAISFDDTFVTTLINIMIPSLSAITTIGSSWYSCRLQMRQLTNLLTVIDQIQCMSVEKRRQYITDKGNMRLLADGLFNYRSSSFVIPNFLVKYHEWSLQKAEQQDVEGQHIELPKLNMPDATTTNAKATQKKSEPATAVKKDAADAKNGNKLPAVVPDKSVVPVKAEKPKSKAEAPLAEKPVTKSKAETPAAEKPVAKPKTDVKTAKPASPEKQPANKPKPANKPATSGKTTTATKGQTKNGNKK